MTTETRIEQTLAQSKSCIQEALSLMEKMAALRSLLLIKEGAGQRYLERIAPSEEQLKKTEQAIRTSYLPKHKPIKSQKKSSLVKAINQKGMA
ncbi:MAG: hypothetical protein PUP46_02655 [Endozoicomonas sp. (ex Botrylloides leachii)]|nr:hypothetical protein [Endozoicomonas sp. (ex Botrylloides leachii)]